MVKGFFGAGALFISGWLEINTNNKLAVQGVSCHVRRTAVQES